jgi:hypothetical protein
LGITNVEKKFKKGNDNAMTDTYLVQDDLFAWTLDRHLRQEPKQEQGRLHTQPSWFCVSFFSNAASY